MPQLIIPKPKKGQALPPGLLFAQGAEPVELVPLKFEPEVKPDMANVPLPEAKKPIKMKVTKPKGPPKPKPEPHKPLAKTLSEKGLALELAELKESPALYSGIHTAFDFLNANLFPETPLPPVIFTLQRKAKHMAYFQPGAFASKKEADAVDALPEIAIHPEALKKNPVDVLAALLCQMVSLWQWTYSEKPGKRGYHNAEYAEKLSSLGIIATVDGTVEGKRTGYALHIAQSNDPFLGVAAKLFATGWSLDHFAQAPTVKKAEKGQRQGRRVKYCCPVPGCGNAMWGKRGQVIKCKGMPGKMHGSSAAMLYVGMMGDMYKIGLHAWADVVNNTYTAGPLWHQVSNQDVPELHVSEDVLTEEYEDEGFEV
jgi:hypothetical protein